MDSPFWRVLPHGCGHPSAAACTPRADRHLQRLCSWRALRDARVFWNSVHRDKPELALPRPSRGPWLIIRAAKVLGSSAIFAKLEFRSVLIGLWPCWRRSPYPFCRIPPSCHMSRRRDGDNAAHAASSGADFKTLRIKGLTVALPGPQDTISFCRCGDNAEGRC